MQQKVNVFLYTSLEESKKRLCATVNDSCEPIAGTQNKYVKFVIQSFQERRSVAQTNTFARMMSSERDSVVPMAVAETTFPSSLFNFLVEGYVKDFLGVPRTELPVLESLSP
jgi:hypothetical protein